MNSIDYNEQYSDFITKLPSDKSTPSYNEVEIVNRLFQQHSKTVDILFNEARESFIVGFLFIVFISFPQIDETIKRFIPITKNSPYFFIITKAIIIMFLYWLLKHFYLSRKN